MSIKHVGSALVGLVCLTLMVGCQPAGAGWSASTQMAPSKAVLVTAGQGYVVYVPAADGTVHALTGENVHMCKQCEMDASAYFKTGHLDATCSVCGAHRSVLVPPTLTGVN